MQSSINNLRITRHEGWAMVELNRPARRNALDRETRHRLAMALRALAGQARAIVLTGTGSAFCAGLDLKERAAAPDDDAHAAEWLELIESVRRHPAVFIAAVNGAALGAGVTLVNACDLAIASEDAVFGCPELAAGAYASASGPTTQLSGVSRKRSAWLLLTTERLSAHTFERWGLLNEVVAPGRLLPRATELAARIAAYEPAALTAVKRALDHIPAVTSHWREAIEYGQRINAELRRPQKQYCIPTQET